MENVKVLSIDNYGAQVNSGTNSLPAVMSAIHDAKKSEVPCVINFSNGRYDFYADKAETRPIFITNTIPERYSADVTKTLGLCIDGMNDITIDGNGAIIMCHNKMISLAILNSENITVKNITIDYVHPTVMEMKVIAEGLGYLDCEVHNSSQYYIKDGKIKWYGDDFSFTQGISQIFDPESGKTWREYSPLEDENLLWEELEFRLLRLHFKTDKLNGQKNQYSVSVGQIFQMRDGIRDQVGVLINDSSKITLENITVHFMHGLGIVSQFSRDISLQSVHCLPALESGRTCAGFADFTHFSACSGLVSVRDCRFIGAQDDAINVHGTYLKIMAVSGNDLVVRFMHDETYGLKGFSLGDEVEAVSADTLCSVGFGAVKAVKVLSSWELCVTLMEDKKGFFNVGDVIENVTCTPEVIIENNYFERIPTRGILVTTRRRIIISGNTFNKMYMSGILIDGDAKRWYESGCVKDVLIEKNTFINCGEPVILIEPKNVIVDEKMPVHRNIRIENNNFISLEGKNLLYAKSVCGLKFTGNEAKGGFSENSVITKSCSDINIEN